MHIDVMVIPQPLGQIGGLAQRAQAAGFSGLLFTETGRTAYLNAAVASQAAAAVTNGLRGKATATPVDSSSPGAACEATAALR